MTDTATIEQLYHHEGMSSVEISDLTGIPASTICGRLNREGSGTRSESVAAQRRYAKEGSRAGWTISPNGYEQIRTFVCGERVFVGIAQLVVIANGADPYKVFTGGEHHVHHKNKMTLDNRPENLELKSASEHVLGHQE